MSTALSEEEKKVPFTSEGSVASQPCQPNPATVPKKGEEEEKRNVADEMPAILIQSDRLSRQQHLLPSTSDDKFPPLLYSHPIAEMNGLIRFHLSERAKGGFPFPFPPPILPTNRPSFLRPNPSTPSPLRFVPNLVCALMSERTNYSISVSRRSTIRMDSFLLHVCFQIYS